MIKSSRAGRPADGLNYTDYVLLVHNNKYDPTIFKILRPLSKGKHGFYDVEVFLANWPQFDIWD
ncbi:MAG: hypothetical protein KA746_14350 [Pyrinomonadaceae bacterium]|nr:hypothetical protein [Pyrinomonadaceae bacterium]MBP6212535.1 hypothetical protein [Pyrinomonadaceae bacterium]